MLTEAGFKDLTDFDISIAQHVAAVISHRAALLVSITTSVIMKRLTCPDITIAIDGSVYKGHPRMHKWLTSIIDKLNSTNKIVCATQFAYISRIIFTIYKHKRHFIFLISHIQIRELDLIKIISNISIIVSFDVG